MRNRFLLFLVSAVFLVLAIPTACSLWPHPEPPPPPPPTEAAQLPAVTPTRTATLPPTSTPIPDYTATPTDTPQIPTATPTATATSEPEQGGGNSCEGEFLGDTFHRIVAGDTLWDISNTYYCTPLEWAYICEKNSWISNCDLIHPDDRRLLYVPLVVQEVQQNGK